MKKFKSVITRDKEEDIVREIKEDYLSRKDEKRAFEQSWLLNINYLIGNQFSYIMPNGEISEKAKSYSYESREVFNHIAPIVDSRLAKLSKIRPKVAVVPASGATEDEEAARVGEAVLGAISEELGFPELIKNATMWSEVTGSAFYKIIPSKTEKNMVEVSVVSPFEIFPFSASIENLTDNPSIIHARAISREDAEEIYNLTGLVGEEISSMSLDFFASGAHLSGASNVMKLAENIKKDQVLVIERYIRPSGELEKGRLQIVVSDRLVYDGDIPFGDYPFVKQVSAPTIGSFWGTSIIDRCIPVQRAYNAIKNRKLEYLARFSAGVLAVEEGSVDIDALEDEGLAPGKVVVYRSGGNAPRFMDNFSIPADFSYEEERLLNELITLTGVSELMRNSFLPTNVTSGRAINLLTEADNTRLAVPSENIRHSILNLSRKILTILQKSLTSERAFRCYTALKKVKMVYFKGSDLCGADVVLDTVNELSESVSEKRSMVMELYKAGLFVGENGKISERDKAKILDMIGFGSYAGAQDLSALHLDRARGENLNLDKAMVLETDEHNLHIDEHTKHILENEVDNVELDRIIAHIREHKAFLQIEKNEN